ncbi:phosphonatase-like hydrolase [Nonomuraea sp. B12E4]|uniref:phosphonatase-like hydrolase n=1 Tax=Nonomuraea sp. B12E4 TaxID=3153564 RepID=UPI00325F13DE
MIELAVLDIAGTTVEEHGAVYRALEEAVRAAGGAPAAADIQRWMGADKREAITALLTGSPAPDAVEAAFADFRARLSAAYAARPPAPLPGVPEAIATLRAAGVKVALTTGFDRDVTTALLAAVGWEHGVLDAVVCVDDVTSGRPAPYMIFRAMEATGVHDVGRVLTAGDTVRDLQAGTNAGARIVAGVLTGGQDAVTLGTARHTHLLPSVADIPALLSPH